MRRISKRLVLASSLLSAVALALSLALGTVPTHVAHAAGAAAGQGSGFGQPRFATVGGVSNFSADATTVPYWRSQFTDPTNGVTYPFTMVGNDPATNSSVTVPTEIIPLRLTFDQSSVPGLTTLDGTSQVADTVNSPVFNASADIGTAATNNAGAPPPFAAGRTVQEPSDMTQVNDAMLRAQWGKTGTGYHVLLGQPTILPTQSIEIPAPQGYISTADQYYGLPYGLIDTQWFDALVINILQSLHVDPRTLPIILTDDVVLADLVNGQPSGCCILAFHAAGQNVSGVGGSGDGNGRQQVLTYIYFSYYDVAYWPPNPGDSVSYVQDIESLTHEVQEWMDDPFVHNTVTPWRPDDPADPYYGCSNLLEVGDPVASYGFTVTINGKDYHPTDVAHFSWFARQSPSVAENGYYTYLNNWPTYAQTC